MGCSHVIGANGLYAKAFKNLDTLSPTAFSYVVRILLVAKILKTLSQLGCSHVVRAHGQYADAFKILTHSRQPPVVL